MRIDAEHYEARRLKASALRVLGQRSISSNGRNYYLTQARELEGSVYVEAEQEFDEDVRALVRSIPIRNFLAAMPTYLDPQKSAESELVVGFRFPDVDEGYTIHVRRGVAEFQPAFPENPDVSITTDTKVWRELVLGVRNPLTTFASDAVEVKGSTLELVRFLRMFSS